MGQRVIITAGWLAAAVLAVLVGLVAINVIGDGLTSSLGKPLAESEVARELARQPSLPSPSPTPSTAAPATAAPTSRSFPTRGGTVVVECTDGSPRIRMSPDQGFEVHEQSRAEGEFRGTSDNHNRVKVSASCDGDTPRLFLEKDER